MYTVTGRFVHYMYICISRSDCDQFGLKQVTLESEINRVRMEEGAPSIDARVDT